MARIKLLQSRDDVSPEHYALFDELAALRGRISGPSSVVLHSPGLARPWNAISEFLHGNSIVEAPQAELAVCATARAFDCGYIWAAHVPQARAAGVSEAALTAVEAGLDDLSSLSRDEARLVLFVRQLLCDHRVDASVFDPLLQAHGPRRLLELTAWAGRYAALAGILNCFEVTPAPEAEVLTPTVAGADTAARRRVSAPLPEPRITPITAREQMEPGGRRIFDAVAEGRGSVRGPFSLLLYSPPLCGAVLELSAYLREDRFLSAATRELAVIATAREQDCPYVWAAHAPAARKEGVSEAVVATVRDRRALGSMPAGEQDVIELAKALLRAHRVDQPLFDHLVSTHGVAGLVDLTAVIGHYVFVTALLNAFEFAPAPGAEALP